MKMKINPYAFYLLFLLITVVGCGNADDDVSFELGNGQYGQGQEVDDCLGFAANDFILSIQSQKTELPAKVSILFKVTDNLNNPIANLTANLFTVYEQGRNDDCFNSISATESQARISPNSQLFSNNTLLVLDLSNSVLQSSLDQLKVAANSFITNVMPAEPSSASQMAIYWFDGEDTLHLLQPLTASVAQLSNAINGISTTISNDPSTDLYGAVIKATDIAEDLVINSTQTISAASIVLFTDGTDQASRYSENAAITAIENANNNISFFSIGLGAEIDQEVLTNIGKTASATAANAQELETTFNQISNSVIETANSFYLFEYCSPKRDGSGDNNLVIQLKQGTRQGAVQTSFSANGFTGGCE